MNTGNSCNTLQVSIQVDVMIDNITASLSAIFAAAPAVNTCANDIISVPVGASPVPIGPLTVAQLGYLFIMNLDQGNPLFVSTNANGSLPFAQINPGQTTVLPAVPGQLYYFRADSSTIAARVLALSS